MSASFENSFGAVNDTIVTVNKGKGWLLPGTRTDVPIKNITSVGVEPRRHLVWCVILFLVALSALGQVGDHPGMFMAALFYGWIGWVLGRGWPVVFITTTNGSIGGIKGWPSQFKTANEFADAVSQRISQLSLGSDNRSRVELVVSK